ncbi:MAG TPA: hypothetical protein VGI16_06935 [Candidatus Acidoferrum sp.]|jgi:hypothetical protein
MLDTKNWKLKRDDLKKQRIPLFEQYENSPYDLTLALKIKKIDDEIAKCTEHLANEKPVTPGSA